MLELQTIDSILFSLFYFHFILFYFIFDLGLEYEHNVMVTTVT